MITFIMYFKITLHVSAQSKTSFPTTCNFSSSPLFSLFVCMINNLAAAFPSGPSTEQTLDVRIRTTATWIFVIAQFLVFRDHWGDTQQVLLSQGKWKLLIYAPASDLLLVCCVHVSGTPCASKKMPLGEFELI